MNVYVLTYVSPACVLVLGVFADKQTAIDFAVDRAKQYKTAMETSHESARAMYSTHQDGLSGTAFVNVYVDDDVVFSYQIISRELVEPE